MNGWDGAVPLGNVGQPMHDHPIFSFRAPGVVGTSKGFTPPIPDTIPSDIPLGDIREVVFVDVLNCLLDEALPTGVRQQGPLLLFVLLLTTTLFV